MIGDGFPDGIVGKYGINVMIEVKDGSKPPSKRLLTDDEAKFHRDWRGWVEVVENEKDVDSVDREVFEIRHKRALHFEP
jgi:hypothetical protein